MTFPRYSRYSLFRLNIAHKLSNVRHWKDLTPRRRALLSGVTEVNFFRSSDKQNITFPLRPEISEYLVMKRGTKANRNSKISNVNSVKKLISALTLSKKTSQLGTKRNAFCNFFKLIALIAGDSILCDKLSWPFVTFYEWSVDESWWAHISINPL